MNTVEPIRDKYLIYEIYDWLKELNKIGVPRMRDYVLVYAGFNIGLRISDLLQLRVSQFSIERKHVIIREQKTGKTKKFIIKPKMRKIVLDYAKENKIDDYLFVARYTNNVICRKTAYEVMKDIEKKFRLENLGTHTLRKTYGYHFYQDKGDKSLGLLQDLFNHASQSITLRYIGISQDQKDSIELDFEI
jgi:integrase